MEEEPGEILTIDELAACLRIPWSALYWRAREGRGSCQKLGQHWRFRDKSIDRWLGHGGTNGVYADGEGA